MTRLTACFRALIAGLIVTSPIACEGARPVPPTGSLAVAGVTLVSGRVVSSVGTPLDSVRILGGVPEGEGGAAEYSVGAFVLSGTSGNYILRIEQTVFDATLVPDTISLFVRADPLKHIDRLPGTTPPTVLTELRVRFGKPSNPSVTVVPDIVLPVAR